MVCYMGFKFQNLDGTISTLDVLVSDYPLRSENECKSKVQYRFGQRLRALFPDEMLLEEFVIPKSGGLALDFFLPIIGWAFEVNGRQHDEYVRFYHGKRTGFVKQRHRDQDKQEWCDLNKVSLFRIRDKDVDDVDIVGLVNG